MLASAQRNRWPLAILPTGRRTSPAAPATSHPPHAPAPTCRAHLPGAESAFEVPLNDVTQANAQKSDAVVEMADDDTALPEDEMLVELRLHVAAATGGVDGRVRRASSRPSGRAATSRRRAALCDFDVPIQRPHLPPPPPPRPPPPPPPHPPPHHLPHRLPHRLSPPAGAARPVRHRALRQVHEAASKTFATVPVHQRLRTLPAAQAGRGSGSGSGCSFT